MTVVSALLLAGMFYATKPASDKNEIAFNKRAILSAVGDHLSKPLDEMSDQEVLNVFDQQMEQYVIDAEGAVNEELLAENIDMAKERKKAREERHVPLFVFYF